MSDIKRMTWRHLNVGDLVIDGVGLASNQDRYLTVEVAEQMTRMFPELEFRLERYDRQLETWVGENT